MNTPDFVDVITSRDYDEYGNPEKNKEKGIHALYKLHGSNKNPLTGEDTRSTVITTLSALGKGKKGDIFSVEVFKRSLFDTVCQDRVLVIAGYSGGDDFDVVPMLSRLKGVKEIVWLHHEQHDRVQAFKVSPSNTEDRMQGIKRGIDALLGTIARQTGVDVIKITGKTSSIINQASSIEPETSVILDEAPTPIDSWLARHLKKPSDDDKEFFAGNVFIQNAMPDKARKHFQKAFDLSKEKGDKPSMAIYSASLGSVSEPSLMIDHYQESLRLFEEIGDQKGLATQHVTLGVANTDAGRLLEALDHLNRAIEIFEREKYYNGINIAYNLAGDLYMMQGKIDKAREYHEKAYQRAQALGDLNSISSCLDSMAQFYANLGQVEQALDFYSQAIEISTKLHNHHNVARFCNNIGIMYQQQGYAEKAMKRFAMAREIQERINDLEGLASTLEYIGILLNMQGKLGEAIEFYEQARAIHESLGLDVAAARDGGNVALGLLHAGRLDDARDVARAALEIFQRHRDSLGIASQYYVIGLVHEKRGEWLLSKSYYEMALDRHLVANLVPAAMDNRIGIAISCLKLGMPFHAHNAMCDALDDATALGDTEKMNRLNAELERIEPSLEDPNTLDVLLDNIPRAQQTGNKETIFDATLAVALHYSDLDMHEEAFKYFEAALLYWTGTRNEGTRIAILNMMAAHLVKLERYNEAMTLYGEIARFHGEHRNVEQRATVTGEHGNVLYYQGKFKAAIKKYMESVEIFESIGKMEDVYNIWGNIGAAWSRLEKHDESHDAYTHALAIAGGTGKKDWQAETLYYLGRESMLAGDEEAAVEELSRAVKSGVVNVVEEAKKLLESLKK
ncbi:MAG: tetratricopeptide repeat protein [Promethearchaeota archaeon]